MSTQTIYERITQTIIGLLESHRESGYQKAWLDVGVDYLARNIETGHVYNGINQLLLNFDKQEYGYLYNRWLTFKQLEKYGAKIKKGSKTSMVVYTSSLYLDAQTGQNRTKEVEFLLRTGQSIEHLNLIKKGYLKDYRVFNVSSVEGLPEHYYEQPEMAKLSEIERDFKADYLIHRTQAEVVNNAQNEAFYHPVKDLIVMPLTAQFINSEAYYAVLSHELVHWTGHPKRLNRTDKPERSKRENYAFEELVAELGSAFLMGYLGYQSRITDQAE